MDRGREVGVRRRHDAHVHGACRRGAEAAHRLLLERAQQLALQLGSEVVHFVEEERAALGYLEQAGLGRLRVGEGAALVAEQLALEQRDRKSTRLNSSHGYISYAVFCLKKKK